MFGAKGGSGLPKWLGAKIDGLLTTSFATLFPVAITASSTRLSAMNSSRVSRSLFVCRDLTDRGTGFSSDYPQSTPGPGSNSLSGVATFYVLGCTSITPVKEVTNSPLDLSICTR